MDKEHTGNNILKAHLELLEEIAKSDNLVRDALRGPIVKEAYDILEKNKDSEDDQKIN